MNVGVMGGTFDPIHNAHLIVAEEVRTRLALSKVLFIPTGEPWLKTDRTVTPAKHRVQMVRLAITGKPYFKLSTIEIERTGPTYTVDTLAELQAQLGAEDELFLIIGWDSLGELPQWREPSRLIQLCHLVAVPRPGYPKPKLKSLEAAVPGLRQRVMLIDKPEIAISASEIRGRVAMGLSVRHLVPEPVNRYIKQHRLYISAE